jgi:hypothetical protein
MAGDPAMPAYIISYDLNQPGQNYSNLYDAIKAQGSSHWRMLDSTWIVVSAKSAVQIRDNLIVHLDDNDKILVLKSGIEAAWGGFNDKGSKWLKENL